MLLRVTTIVLALVALCSADILTLRSGQVVRGEYLGGDARHVKMAVGDRVENYSVDDVQSLQFGGGQRLEGAGGDRRDSGFAQQQAPPPPPPAYSSALTI